MNGTKDDTYSDKPIRLGTVNKGGQGERIYSTKGIAITLSAYGGGVFAKTGGYWINGKTRRLHPRECARIMGYPDTYKICSNANQAYQQFGNSVVIDVLQLITEQISLVLEP
jgi:DNA (cytosine-5)-methyltransferase 1